MSQPTVLVVEDEASFVEALQIGLSREGFRVEIAGDGIEALERFVRREPLRRVHECVLGVLALECEATDPRL